MRLGGPAAYLTEVNERNEVVEAVKWAKDRGLPIIVVGDGSNIVWRDEGFKGLVIVNRNAGFEIKKFDEEKSFVTVGGGENWDSVVERTVQAGLSGIEYLSLIPGTAGAAPVQNIGAYGGQLSDVLLTIEVYDIVAQEFRIMMADDCSFGYRNSRFKNVDHGKFVIVSLVMQLSAGVIDRPLYHTLQTYFDEHKITERSPATIRQAVIELRNSRLPNPALVANNGSFFKLPIIDRAKADQLLEDFPKLANWPSTFMWDLPDGKVKIAAGALLEHEGFKGFHDPETGMATWDKQALVLVNEHAHNTADLLKFKQKIVDTVQAKFGIALEQEPELLP